MRNNLNIQMNTKDGNSMPGSISDKANSQVIGTKGKDFIGVRMSAKL